MFTLWLAIGAKPTIKSAATDGSNSWRDFPWFVCVRGASRGAM